jgi:ribonuclease HI
LRDGLGIIDEDALNIFTDGSSKPKQKRNAGVGFRLVWVNELGNEETDEDFVPGWQSATIDEMEIKACSEALKYAKRFIDDFSVFKKILIFSDSQYVVNNFVSAINVWPKRKWKKNNGLTVANVELWKELIKEIKSCPIRVDIKWVKAHKSNIHNRAADDLATMSALMPVKKPISKSVTTRKWSNRSTKRGCVPISGQTTKIRIISREYLNKDKLFEYRYEIIDPTDKSYKDLDFIYFEEGLSRNKCYEVKFNNDQSKPAIDEIINELDCAEYKY